MIDEAPPDQACAYCGGRTYHLVVSYPQGTAVRCIQCRLVRSFPYPSFDYQDNKDYAQGYKGRERLFARFAKDNDTASPEVTAWEQNEYLDLF